MSEQNKSFVPMVQPPSIRFGGHFYVDLIDAQSGVVKEHHEFPNIITDRGLDLIGIGTTMDAMYHAVQVGVGTRTPLASDTALEFPLATRSSNNGGFANITATNTTPEYAFRRYVRVFTESQVIGNLTEVGFWNSANNVLVNRALFRDSLGNITAITKTDQDILRIVFEARIYAPLTDIVSGFDYYQGNVSIYTLRPMNVGLASGWNFLFDSIGLWDAPRATIFETTELASRTGNNRPLNGAEAFRRVVYPYTEGEFFRDVEYSWYSFDGNFLTGIGLMTFSTWRLSDINLHAWQMSFSPKIPKNDTLNFRMVMRQQWGRL